MLKPIKHYVYIILNLIQIYSTVCMCNHFYKNKFMLWTKCSEPWARDLHLVQMSAGQNNLFLEVMCVISAKQAEAKI